MGKGRRAHAVAPVAIAQDSPSQLPSAPLSIAAMATIAPAAAAPDAATAATSAIATPDHPALPRSRARSRSATSAVAVAAPIPIPIPPSPSAPNLADISQSSSTATLFASSAPPSPSPSPRLSFHNLAISNPNKHLSPAAAAAATAEGASLIQKHSLLLQLQSQKASPPSSASASSQSTPTTSAAAAAPGMVFDAPHPPLYDAAAAPPDDEEHVIEAAPLAVLVTTYLSYFILIVFGHLQDFFGALLYPAAFRHFRVRNGYAPLSSGFDTFYHRRLYLRIRDCFGRPVTDVPGRTIRLLERSSSDHNRSFTFTGSTRDILNLSSYNYLGFAQSQGPCADAVESSVRKYGLAFGSPRSEAGSHDLHASVEALIARFLNTEDAVVFSMGFATNSTCIPALAGRGDLILSDELNHSSIVFGARLSNASIRTFKHNSPQDLEAVLRDAIAQGQPRTHRPWKRILVIVEGLYSMEGNIVNLPAILDLRDKYRFYLYLDEAHSIGALGPNGRGVCDYYGLDPSRVDILMGTFTKSFGAAGGYIAGSRALVNHLRLSSHSSVYAEPMPVPLLVQIETSMRIIMGEVAGSDGTLDEGRHRIQTLARNSRYFASELRRMGFIVYGRDSPVIPLLLFHPAKIPAFSREMLARGIGVVVVGHPATPIITSRVRFCISASHTIDDLEYALEQISDIGDLLGLKLRRSVPWLTSKLARLGVGSASSSSSNVSSKGSASSGKHRGASVATTTVSASSRSKLRAY